MYFVFLEQRMFWNYKCSYTNTLDKIKAKTDFKYNVKLNRAS